MRVVREFLEFEADVCRQSVTEDTNNIDRLRGIKASFETRFGWWFEWRNHEVWSTWLPGGFGGFSNPNQTKHHCTWSVASQSTNIYPNWLIIGIILPQNGARTGADCWFTFNLRLQSLMIVEKMDSIFSRWCSVACLGYGSNVYPACWCDQKCLLVYPVPIKPDHFLIIENSEGINDYHPRSQPC